MSPQEFLSKFSPRSLVTLDLGNSHPHYGVFLNGNLIEVNPLKKDPQSFIVKQDSPVHVSSVRKNMTSSFAPLIKEGSFMDMKVDYSTTLGHDRLIASYFLYHWIKKPFLLVDAGTFMTLDLGSEEGFEGGYILPGLRTFSHSYQLGDQLFRPKSHGEEKSTLAHNTQEAIEGGIHIYQQALVEKIKELSVGRTLVFSGGEATFFANSFPKSLVVPHLIHYALYFQYLIAH